MNSKAFVALFLVICLHFSLTVPVMSQSAPRGRSRSRTQARRTAAPEVPSVSVVSDRSLNNLLIEHRDNVFIIRIREVGVYRVSGTGRGYDAFEQQQSPDGTDLALSFRLLPGVMPQYVRDGNQIDIYFTSSPLSAATMQRAPAPAPSAGQMPQLFPPEPHPSRPPQVGGFDSRRTERVDLRAETAFSDLPPLPPATTAAADGGTAVTEAPAGPQTCKAKCKVPEAEKEGEFAIVNANAPGDFEGQRKFPRGGKVFFDKKNPYKYAYRIVCRESDIASGIIDAFVGRIGIPDLAGIISPAAAITGPAQRPSTVAPSSESPGAVGREPCQGKDAEELERLWDYAIKLQATIAERAKTLGEKTKTFNDAKKAYNAFLEQTDTDELNCEGACQSANDLLPQLKKVDLGDMANAIATLKDAVTTLRTLSGNYTPTDPASDKTACTARFRVLKAAADGYSTSVTELETKFTALKTAIDENQGKFDDMAKIINNVNAVIASGGNPFIEVRNLRADEDGKEVSCTIARKNLRVSGATEVAFNDPVTFQVGESRISLSAGFGFSTINEIKIIRQSSLVPGEDGTPTLGTRFGFENRSKFRPSAVIMLNAHLHRFNLFDKDDATFAFSGGLVLSNRTSSEGGSSIATEFIAGPSVGFLNNRMFMTFGFHAARVEQLAGDFKIGDPVPANLPDPLPVEKNWRNGLMFSITYRIRPR